MRRHVVFTLCAIALVGALLVAPHSTTAEGMSNDTIRVSPAITNLHLQPSQTSTSVVTTVTNLTAGPLSVTLGSQDFGALNESGTVGFYGANYTPGTNPHALENVMSFSAPSVYLAPHASQKVTVKLTNLGSLAAGGHFGAALFTPGSPLATPSKTNVSIKSSIASLIFLVTASGGTQRLQLLPLHIGAISFSLPALSYIGFNNAGNTQAAVRGQLTLYGPNGGIVSTTTLNPGSGLVLPGTARVFPTTLPLPNNRFARPGIYRLELQYEGDMQHKFITMNQHFYYINIDVFLPLVLAIICIIYLGKWHGKKALKTSKHVAHKSIHTVRKLRRKNSHATPDAEPTKKRKHRQVQG